MFEKGFSVHAIQQIKEKAFYVYDVYLSLQWILLTSVLGNSYLKVENRNLGMVLCLTK